MRVVERGIKTKSPELVYGPQWLLGGRHVLYTLSAGSGSDEWDRASIFVQSVNGNDRKQLIRGGADGPYLSSGDLVYALGGTLYAVRFDLKTLSVLGNPVSVLERVQRSLAEPTGAAQFSVSSNGILACIPGPTGNTSAMFDIAFTDRKGDTVELGLRKGPYAYRRGFPPTARRWPSRRTRAIIGFTGRRCLRERASPDAP